MIRPARHLPGANEDDVARVQLEVLLLQAILQVLLADPVAWRQDLDALHASDIEQHPSCKDRRVLLRPALGPGAVAEILFGAELVEDLSVVPKMVESIDMGPAMRIHRDTVA